jgi:hypothetical protein
MKTALTEDAKTAVKVYRDRVNSAVNNSLGTLKSLLKSVCGQNSSELDITDVTCFVLMSGGALL